MLNFIFMDIYLLFQIKPLEAIKNKSIKNFLFYFTFLAVSCWQADKIIVLINFITNKMSLLNLPVIARQFV